MSVPRTTSLLYVAASSILLLAACGDDAVEPETGLQLTISPDSATIDIADTLQLVATLTDTAGRRLDRTVNWTSETPEVAGVLPSGRVTARAEGVAIIRATVVGGASAEATIRVVRFPAASLTVEPSSVIREPGKPLELTATLRSEEGRRLAGRQVVWASGDETIASVWPTGILDPVARGTTTITATHEDLVATVEVTVLFQITALAGASAHTCAITAESSVYCWGDNREGQLGVGLEMGPDECGNPTPDMPVSFPCSLIPVPAAAASEFRVVEGGGDHSCGLTFADELLCWGWNGAGQLGDGTTDDRFRPTAVAGGLTFQSVSTGTAHTCGLLPGGSVRCWGSNGLAALGDGTTEDRAEPASVAGDVTFGSLTAGTDVTCGLTPAAEAFCWGWNGSGQLGAGSFEGPETCELDQNLFPCSRRPVPVSDGIEFVALSAGSGHVCGLDPAGVAHCWGSNGFGELGDGTTMDRAEPVAVAGGLTFSAIAAAGTHTCGLGTDGHAYCWGANGSGQLGVPPSDPQPLPARVSGDIQYVAISTGAQSAHTCGLGLDGNAYCWGANNIGQLGDATEEPRPEPTLVFRQ